MIENFNLNYQIFYFLNNFSWKNHYLDNFYIFISKYLIFILIIIFIIYFSKLTLKQKNNKKYILKLIFFISGPITAWIITKILKNFLKISRPFITLKNIVPLISENKFYESFPSGHATLSFAIASTLFLYNKKLGYFSFFLATLIALSRVITGVHFPLDIVIGSIIGTIIPIIFYLIIKNK